MNTSLLQLKRVFDTQLNLEDIELDCKWFGVDFCNFVPSGLDPIGEFRNLKKNNGRKFEFQATLCFNETYSEDDTLLDFAEEELTVSGFIRFDDVSSDRWVVEIQRCTNRDAFTRLFKTCIGVTPAAFADMLRGAFYDLDFAETLEYELEEHLGEQDFHQIISDVEDKIIDELSKLADVKND